MRVQRRTLGVDDAEEEQVYRPLLFNSTGYASSDLHLDSFEMHSRLPTVSSSIPLSDVRTTTGVKENQRRRDTIEPKLRLETLSSQAATVVLSVTYLSFFLAMMLPYLQSNGYMERVVELSGAVCKSDVWGIPCIEINRKRNVAEWAAYVTNVSRYTGSIELKLDVRSLVNNSTLTKLLKNESEMKQALKLVETVWDLHPNYPQVNNIDRSKGSKDFVAEGTRYILTYDTKLFGMDEEVVPATKDLILDKQNQSVWVECQVEMRCDKVQLLEITQDVDRTGVMGYNAYYATVTFQGLYPNIFGKDVVYDFTYKKPAIHIGEVIVRGVLVLISIVAFPCWFISVLNFHDGLWSKVLLVQKWVIAFGVVLLLWQNPAYAISELYTTPSLRARWASITCQSLAEVSFYVIWLSLVDQYCGELLSWRKFFATKFLFGLVLLSVDTWMTELRMTGLFPRVKNTFTTSQTHFDELYTVLGFTRMGLVLLWLVRIVKAGAKAGKHLKTLPYMATRYKQLSYRFVVLLTLLIFVYILALSALQTFHLIQTWYFVGCDAFTKASVHTFAKMHTGYPPLGQILFLSLYVYLVMFVHLPPLAGDKTGFLASTAFHVHEKSNANSFDLFSSSSNLFCVETAGWLLELAYQAYFDPPGCPSLSGYGELALEQHGFELITHLRSRVTDTHAVVAWSQEDHRRLVISFRGTTSKENWRSNLRADQTVLWIKSRDLRWQRSCLDKMKDVAAKVPLLNMALPRVHRGFWIAYESIRDELKEATRLILDENPGITIYITGHSMGGALAVLAAYDLAVNFSIQVTMYNFGGPRVGNPSFRQHFDSCVPTSYRVVMDGDIVPGWPRFWGLYQHVGTEVSIDIAGNLIVDPSFIERHLHNTSRRKTSMHGTNVYRLSIANCLTNFTIFLR